MNKPILTPRLLLIPLSEPQLRISLFSPSTMAGDLGISISRELFEGVAEKAIHLKLAKMETASPVSHPWFTYWLIVLKNEGIGIGLAGFKGLPDENGSVEIGYGLHENYRRNGYMSEAVKAICKWAFSQPECQSITATHVLSSNKGSKGVLSNAGFKEISSSSEGVNFRLDKMEHPNG